MSGCVDLHCECCVNFVESEIAMVLLKISILPYQAAF